MNEWKESLPKTTQNGLYTICLRQTGNEWESDMIARWFICLLHNIF